MKAIQEVIRLHAAGLSQRQIAQACRLSKGALGKYLQKAEQASISWPLPPEMDPAKLEALLFPSHRSATVTAQTFGPHRSDATYTLSVLVSAANGRF